MKVFISWSGARSKAVAELMNDWIRCVLQAARPWLSTRDLDRGSLWFGEINDQLKDTKVGVICLTQENKDRPWILFEAGALAKGISTNRVCTFLVDLEPKDIRDPLAQFNHTLPERDHVLSLVETMNSLLEQQLDPRVLVEVFNTYWPSFESGFRKILEDYPPSSATQPRAESDMLAEILDYTRNLNHRVGKIEREFFEQMADRKRGSNIEDTVRIWVRKGMFDQDILHRLAQRGYANSHANALLKKVYTSPPEQPPNDTSEN
jgi:hypothetical protein